MKWVTHEVWHRLLQDKDHSGLLLQAVPEVRYRKTKLGIQSEIYKTDKYGITILQAAGKPFCQWVLTACSWFGKGS